MASCTKHKIVVWSLQIVCAAILGQTLFFKFSGAEESRYIFATLGAEPWGRYLTGGAEMVAVVLLLHPVTPILGAGLSIGLMAGAIGSHLTRLGIVVKDDGGLLFALACLVFLCSWLLVWLRRGEIARFAPRSLSRFLPLDQTGQCSR